jgi:SAM-dependent methyltransferase
MEEYWLRKSKIPTKLWQIIQKNFDPGAIALDLGCAGGRLSKAIKPYFKKCFAIDKSESLLKIAKVNNPEIFYFVGDFGDEKTWLKLGEKFDVIVSDCAVRKDYVEINNLIDICKKNLNKDGRIILRIQCFGDLMDLLDENLSKSLFYNEEEICFAFKNTNFKIFQDFYTQNFSTKEYLLNYLSLINIKAFHLPKNRVKRKYLIVEAGIR